MTTGLQPSNSMGKDLLGWKLIDINCGEKEANRHSVVNSLIQTLIPKANLKGCSDQQKRLFSWDVEEKSLNFTTTWKSKIKPSATECWGCSAD